VSELPPDHDERTRRCPRLGHDVSFRYCRTMEGERLCPRLLDCWWETFDVRDFIAEHLGPEALEQFDDRPPPDKVGQILGLIRQARERADGSGTDEAG